jgi:hypothetical protein
MLTGLQARSVDVECISTSGASAMRELLKSADHRTTCDQTCNCTYCASGAERLTNKSENKPMPDCQLRSAHTAKSLFVGMDRRDL